MRRLVLIGIGAALLAAFPMTHEAMANNGRKAPQVDVCHNASVLSTRRVGTCARICDGRRVLGAVIRTVWDGQVITVNGNAVGAHLAHGDSASFGTNPRDDTHCRFVRTRCTASCD